VPPQRGTGSLAQRTYQPLLRTGHHKLIGFARRSQGLIVAKGNPLALRSIAGLASTRARFVNRAIGTGTRVLFDELLAQAKLDPRRIEGYASAEPSHSAVAQAVASGAADAGLGIEPAARARGLDFVPLLHEDYYLVCLKDALDEPPVQALRSFLRGRAWQDKLRTLPGYEPLPEKSGEVLSLTDQLPWWSFRTSKS
jgi:putative molybdopterin biosynthesis protein